MSSHTNTLFEKIIKDMDLILQAEYVHLLSGFNIKQEMLSFVLNVILVINGFRKAYYSTPLICVFDGESININEYLLGRIRQYVNIELEVIPLISGYLICIKDDMVFIIKELVSSNPVIGMGKILGYDYVKSNHITSPNETTFTVRVCAEREYYKVELYSYTCPYYNYNLIKRNISNTIEKIDSILTEIKYTSKIYICHNSLYRI